MLFPQCSLLKLRDRVNALVVSKVHTNLLQHGSLCGLLMKSFGSFMSHVYFRELFRGTPLRLKVLRDCFQPFLGAVKKATTPLNQYKLQTENALNFTLLSTNQRLSSQQEIMMKFIMERNHPPFSKNFFLISKYNIQNLSHLPQNSDLQS